MKLCWITLHVNDLAKSLEFYQGLLNLETSNHMKINEDYEIIFLKGENDAQVELIWDKNEHVENVDRSFSVGLEVNNLDELVELAKKSGVKKIDGPITPNPHMRFYFLGDPDGYNIQLVEIIK